MEFGDVVRRRRMVRNYDAGRPVPREAVDRLLEHALRAPSAGFSQGWGFLVLDDAAGRERFWTATTPPGRAGQATKEPGPTRLRQAQPGRKPNLWLDGMRRAPLIVVPHANRSAYLDRYAEPDKGWTDRDPARWPAPYWDIDAGFAALLMLLTAVDEGLGACFFGIPPERIGAFRDTFGVPEDFRPIGAITVGYPAPDRRSPSLKRGRRPVEAVVHWGRWATNL